MYVQAKKYSTPPALNKFIAMVANADDVSYGTFVSVTRTMDP